MPKSTNLSEQKKIVSPVQDRLVLQNQFRVIFDSAELLSEYLLSFKYDMGYREYTIEFNLPTTDYEKINELASTIKRFTLEVFDTNGNIVFRKHFISSRLLFCATEFNYQYNNPVILRIKGNF